ncbi:molybdate ABC transporter permease subunit [Phaeospirillum tilakii]|uniref:Molybdenum transport system permease n=1 Tax=Phaeospirillum tilakii TaxID=741673 RepID=A0ABW5CGQ1_9PROT
MDPAWFVLTPLEREALALSLLVSGWAVVGSLPFGVLFAWLLARRDFPGKSLLDGVIHLPLVLPPVVVGYALLVLFGRRGVIGAALYDWFGVTVAFTWKGAAIASAVVAFPLMVRAIRLALEGVDRRLEQAARTLGCGPVRTFFVVTLPLAAPGLLAGVILAFARSLSEFGATITFVSNIPGETRTLPIALYALTQVPGGDAPAFRLCVISVVVAFAALLASEILARRVRERIGS